MIALNDLARIDRAGLDALRGAYERVIASGWYVLGEEAATFERDFADYCGAAHCVGVANGTDALEIALRTAGILPGDKVVTTANAGMYATIAITACAAEPVFVDVDAVTMCMSVTSLKTALAQRPRAVIVTHLYGRLAAIEELVGVARAAGSVVIEDCPQAHGARLNGKHAGSFGDIGCFSFYPTKNLGALGDGGAIVANEKSFADRARQLRQYGWGRKYHCELPGGRNSRLDEMQAALLNVKLGWLDRQNDARRSVARRYFEGIHNAHIATERRDAASDVVHLYIVRTPHRAQLARHLLDAGVQTDIHYPLPDHRQPMFANRFASTHLPVTEKLADEILTLPCHPALREEEIVHVIDACNRFKP
ncbi:MAG: DegT/DnrJ/EryC1/StrS family aminotransferase [Burkholderiales bacterium]|nr:DegT/DnrJ/EryC1/StrS family aminotransferase [Burkholderiales bacterium]